MLFSICICTYNRAEILTHCLKSLTKISIPIGGQAEILVIDNNSVDNTMDVVDQFSKHSPIVTKYFHEKEQGLSAARNRAIREARGDYIGFLDDECVVKPNWLEVIVADVDEFAPFIIGGPYTGAMLPGTSPKWFKTEYGNAYFLAKKFERGYQKEFRASGGNMILHRTVCEAQQFDRNLGQKGKEIKLGEEMSVQDRFLSENVGTMVFYEPRIEVAHYILPEKMRLSYHARRQMEIGACHHSIRLAALPYHVARILAHICSFPFGAAFRDRGLYPYWQNYLYEVVIPRTMPAIGAALEKFRRRYH
jgi:glycosyltransferase involved in cell wall biosynthesis